MSATNRAPSTSAKGTAGGSLHGLPEFLVGNGFYKLGYVTTDREQAIGALRDQFGFSDFYRFEPDLLVETSDGERGRAHLQCAFTVGHNILVEVMEPLDGLVETFTGVLGDQDGFQLAFHHVGVLVDDFAAANAQMKAAGFPSLWECRQPGFIEVSYHQLPLLGHMVEIVEYGPGSDVAKHRARATG